MTSAVLASAYPEHLRAEVERYLGRVRAERDSQERADDSTADEARRTAADLEAEDVRSPKLA